MLPTEPLASFVKEQNPTKSYTPGAERAARAVRRTAWDWEASQEETAALISRETHDAEMLEALRLVASKLCGCYSQPDDNWGHSERCHIPKVLAVIAKVEGQ